MVRPPRVGPEHFAERGNGALVQRRRNGAAPSERQAILASWLTPTTTTCGLIEVEVEVLVDGEWLLGDLEAVDEQAGVWRGWVRFSAGPGTGNYLDWFSVPNIRKPVRIKD
jgi:hypothetical protein